LRVNIISWHKSKKCFSRLVENIGKRRFGELWKTWEEIIKLDLKEMSCEDKKLMLSIVWNGRASS
jgi:hypothetical protein